jgi:hypothetical protein
MHRSVQGTHHTWLLSMSHFKKNLELKLLHLKQKEPRIPSQKPRVSLSWFGAAICGSVKVNVAGMLLSLCPWRFQTLLSLYQHPLSFTGHSCMLSPLGPKVILNCDPVAYSPSAGLSHSVPPCLCLGFSMCILSTPSHLPQHASVKQEPDITSLSSSGLWCLTEGRRKYLVHRWIQNEMP